MESDMGIKKGRKIELDTFWKNVTKKAWDDKLKNYFKGYEKENSKLGKKALAAMKEQKAPPKTDKVTNKLAKRLFS